MKDKIKKTLITFFILLGGLILCMGLYQLFDQLLNGVLLDWLDSRFVQYNWIALDSEGNGYYHTSIRWMRVKEYLFRGFVFLVLFLAFAGRLFVLMYAAKR